MTPVNSRNNSCKHDELFLELTGVAHWSVPLCPVLFNSQCVCVTALLERQRSAYGRLRAEMEHTAQLQENLLAATRQLETRLQLMEAEVRAARSCTVLELMTRIFTSVSPLTRARTAGEKT